MYAHIRQKKEIERSITTCTYRIVNNYTNEIHCTLTAKINIIIIICDYLTVCPPPVTRDCLCLLLYITPGSLSVSINCQYNEPHPLIINGLRLTFTSDNDLGQ